MSNCVKHVIRIHRQESKTTGHPRCQISYHSEVEVTRGLGDQTMMNVLYLSILLFGDRDHAVVRALTTHQCVLGSIPGPSVICGLSLLLVLFLAPRGFSPGSPVFLSPGLKNRHFQIPTRFGLLSSTRSPSLGACNYLIFLSRRFYRPIYF